MVLSFVENFPIFLFQKILAQMSACHGMPKTPKSRGLSRSARETRDRLVMFHQRLLDYYPRIGGVRWLTLMVLCNLTGGSESLSRRSLWYYGVGGDLHIEPRNDANGGWGYFGSLSDSKRYGGIRIRFSPYSNGNTAGFYRVIGKVRASLQRRGRSKVRESLYSS